MSAGWEPQKHKFAKLLTLMRKERGYKAGRKKNPRSITVVEAADDSAVDAKNISNSSILIPTVTTDDQLIKVSCIKTVT